MSTLANVRVQCSSNHKSEKMFAFAIRSSGSTVLDPKVPLAHNSFFLCNLLRSPFPNFSLEILGLSSLDSQAYGIMGARLS